MATYEDIYGKRVKEFDSEPTLSSAYEGQVWYDKSSGTLKSVVLFDSVISGGNMNTARGYLAGFGTQTASVIAGGAPAGTFTQVEHYDGIGWSEQTDTPTGFGGAGGAGTQTAGLIFGGYAPGLGGITTTTLEYNGSSWTSGGSLNTARSFQQMSAGTQTAGLGFGGYAPGGDRSETEEYDGSSWSASTAMPVARGHAGGTGTQTAGLTFGGRVSGSINSTTLSYNGSSWTSENNLGTAFGFGGSAGTQTASLAMAGSSTIPLNTTNKVQGYNGTSWSEKTTFSTARRYLAGTGTGTAALGSGGRPPDSNATEEFHSSINTITAAAWSSTPAVNTGRGLLAGGGTATAGLIFGGNTSASINYVNNSEEWDGTSWTEGNDLATARGNGIGGCGTQTAGLAFCGDVHPTSPRNTADTEEYDGSSWSEANDVNTARRGTAGAGIQTAAVMAGGYSTTNINNTEEYDGTNWSNGNTMPYSRANITIAGTQTAAILAAGSPASPTATLEYDGTNWTASAAYPAMPVYSVGSSGIQTAALFFGGFSPPPVLATTVGYDGTSFSTRPSMGTAKYGVGPTSAGPSTSTIAAAGASYPSPVAYTTSEEFSGGTETANIADFTTS